MDKIQLDGDKSLIFLGDHHGDWFGILSLIEDKKITNSYIFSVGDLGIGFKYKKEFEHEMSKKLNKEFASNNNTFLGIRGNHDNPLFFTGNDRIELENFKLIEDYAVFEYKNKTIQGIGGAISIDRVARKEGISYWTNEGVSFNKEKCQNVDILVTHTAPSRCFPQTFNELVYGWAKEDAFLIEELTKERAAMDEIFKLCSPSQHFYGHFHSSWNENIEGCRHRLLSINEFFEARV